MISFECDYNNGAHPSVLKHLVETNDLQSLTYGYDEWSESAKTKIRKACECEDADIFFLVGGTQTNETVIDGYLEGYHGVIACETGHINVHEAGAIEFSGHKIITLPSHDGKLWAEDLERYMEWFIHDESNMHLAQPGMVYITFPTELGSLYTAKEISRIYEICKRYELKLFIDGARLGYGIAASDDITLPFLASHCDVFYIGGTKVGALCGEAVVFTHGAPKHFFTIIKQHGALVAKGRLIGLQFDALFTDHLYLNISKHAIDMAMRMKQMFIDKGYKLFIDSPTNQQFVIIPNDKVRQLEKQVIFTHWEPYKDDSLVCRFVTSWATTEEQMNYLESIL
ncbi:MAG: amino acid lyase [Prevotella sp.]|jgi:threonine aldolase|nr:amino acid lyase [Prevotella sp.]